jgi:hypothetical protein
LLIPENVLFQRKVEHVFNRGIEQVDDRRQYGQYGADDQDRIQAAF